MDRRTEEFLKNAPDHPMRSRLEPHRDLIRELRRKGYPYRKIVTILRDHFALQTSKSALHDLVKVRARSDPRRNQLTLPSSTLPSSTLPPSFPAPSQGQSSSDPDEAVTIGPSSSSPASQADVYAHFEELKRRKRAAAPPQPKPRFHYEEGEPLRLVSDRNPNTIKRS
jgi:hypothetical protein